MLTADNAYIADNYKFLTKEQLVLTNKTKSMKIAQPYAAISLLVKNCTALCCYHLVGEKLHSLMLLSPCW